MADYTVDLQILEKVSNALGSSLSSINKALSALENLGPKTSGYGQLDDACDDFHDNWAKTTKRMAGDIQAIQKNINTNGESYATAETKGGGRFSGSNIQAL